MSALPTDKAMIEAFMDEAAFEAAGCAAIARLDEQDIERIDRAILSALGDDWKKAGFITSGMVIAAPDEYEEVPEMFYTMRIRALAEASRIEGRGDPHALKTFEIRLPPRDTLT
ncbi:hypothetical protein E2F46_16170 [Luteimonas aestuarii]|uniref:Uncharacterized protein n=1 Tax=Luteimonas aestuarii TaxID=453837 RepID=A0A4R5TRJ1_9GAMM|nr:hypothetical protein [Luteimonas aestuarii]TDK20337.1 hypothetical protein E2F46_16170 [Luteimonas aestuarii]